jgi:hypothetical protein
MISTPNFVYPTEKVHFNLSEIEDRLKPDPVLLTEDASVRDYFDYALIRDRIPSNIRSRVLDKLSSENSIQGEDEVKNESPEGISYIMHNDSAYHLDEQIISEVNFDIF